MLLAMKMVFLFGINLRKTFLDIVQKPSKWMLRASLIVLLILSSFNFEAYSQNCDEGLRFCRGRCRTPRECRQGVPPPPGLPIDSKLPYLLIAGLGLGIYFLRSRKQA